MKDVFGRVFNQHKTKTEPLYIYIYIYISFFILINHNIDAIVQETPNNMSNNYTEQEW